MTAVPQPAGFPRRGKLAEYFALDAAAPEGVRYEYAGGTIISMPGGTPAHSLVTMQVGAAIVFRLRGSPCRVYSSDLKVGVAKRTYCMHPDVTVVCGPLEMDPRDPTEQTVLNPKLIIETLSPSTEAYDRGQKFSRYMGIESLQEYVLVSQDRPRAESLFRQTDGTWSYTYADGVDATLKLRALSIEIPLAEVFANITFPPIDEESGLITEV